MGGPSKKGGAGGGAGGGGAAESPTERAANRAGIELETNRADAEDLGRQAASVINNQRRSGYTVYGNETYTGNGWYGGVGYGAESASAIANMRKILRQNGYKVTTHPDGGLIVGR